MKILPIISLSIVWNLALCVPHSSAIPAGSFSKEGATLPKVLTDRKHTTKENHGPHPPDSSIQSYRRHPPYQSSHDAPPHASLEPRTRSRVAVTMITRVAGAAIPILLNEAFGVIIDTIESRHHDIPMPSSPDGDPVFKWYGREGYVFEAWNDRQMTFGTLKDAVAETYRYLHEHGWGEAFITIWDGGLQVGEARILGPGK